MAGGHASSRVDSGSMKFRPTIASSRRAIPSTPNRAGPSGSSVTSTPSKQPGRPIQPASSLAELTSGSETEGPDSSSRPRSVTAPRIGSSVRIAPGISRAPATRINQPSNQSSHPPSSSVAGTPASGSAVATPQARSSVTPLSSTQHEAANIGTSQNASARSKFVTPIPKPVFAPPAARPSTGTSLLDPIITAQASFLSPPPSQASPTYDQNEPDPSISVSPRAITIGQTRHTTGVLLPTPPATQAAPSFPLDPRLGGQEIEPLFSMVEHDPPLNLGVAPMVLSGSMDHLEGTQATLLTQEVDQMPPPPPLPSVDEPAELEVPQEGNRSEGEPSAPPKKRRTRRTTKGATEGQTKRQKRSHAEPNEQTDDDGGEETSEKPKRKRGRKTSGGGRKAATLEDRISALEKHAAEAAEQGILNEPLDPTNATMASLCEVDLPTGRLSSKFLEKGIAYVKHVEDRRKRIMERTAERLKMLRASGLDPENPRQPLTVKKPEPTPAPESANDNSATVPSTSNLIRELGASLSPSPEPEPAEMFAESAAAPQIRFVNGEMVLDEESQFYDRTAAAQAQQDEDSMVIVDEADSTRFSNSASFAKREGARGSRWTADETELFYWCLSAFGEDYENIARYLGRTPGQCKNKTKAEDRKGNEKRITMAIKTRVPLDLEEFGRITGRDFSGPPPEIRAPTVPPPAERQEGQQEPVVVGAKVKASSSAPNTPRKKGKTPARDGEEEIMTLEEYERDAKDD